MLLERMAEMCRIIEPPEKRDFRDAFLSGSRVAQVLPAMFQPLYADPIRNRRTSPGKQAVQMAHGDSHCGCDFCWAQRPFGQMVIDILQNTRQRLFARAVPAVCFPGCTLAGRQYFKICFHACSALVRRQRSRLLIKRSRQMEKSGTQSFCPRYSRGVGNLYVPD